MAARMASSAVIGRPVNEVFEYMINMDKNGLQWAPDLESVTKLSDGPVRAGTTFAQTQRMMGRRREGTLTFSQVVPNRRIQAELRSGPVQADVTATFEEAAGGTRVTVTGVGKPRGPLALLSPLFARMGTRIWDARFAKLKQVLEA